MDTRYLKKIGFYILSALLAIALICYIVYHALDGFSTDISTVTAELVSNKSVISSKGYIFRDEEYLYSSYGGAAEYAVSDGEKVGIGKPVVTTYSDALSASVISEISGIEDKLKIIKKSEISSGALNTDTSTSDKKISSYYMSILSSIADGEYGSAVKSSADMLVQLNRRQIITGDRDNFNDIKESLENKKLRLEAGLTGRSETVFAPSSGYFFAEIDGYEEIFTSEAAENLTLHSFFELTEKAPKNIGDAERIPVGKIAKSFIWYIAIPMELSEANRLSVGTAYSAVFPYNNNASLTLKAEKLLSEIREDTAVVLFSCGEMPESFSYIRSQSVEIELSESEGFRVPMSAVRVLDGVKGVYTLYGSIVEFKRIDILFDSDGYYMVSRNDPLDAKSQETGNETATKEKPKYEYLELYDKIITKSKNLEHGMVFY